MMIKIAIKVSSRLGCDAVSLGK